MQYPMRTLSTESAGGSTSPTSESVSAHPSPKKRRSSPIPSFSTLHAAAAQAAHRSHAGAAPALDREAGEQLLRAIQGGDRQALARLYTCYAPALRSAALCLLGDPAQAEDLLHDVFFEAWRCAQSYDSARAGVFTWLLVRLRSRAIDQLRSAARRRRLARRARQHTRPYERFGDSPEDRYLTLALGRDLARLPSAQRQLLDLTYLQDLPLAEVAAELGCPIGTVKSRLHRLLRSLGTSAEPAPPGTDPEAARLGWRERCGAGRSCARSSAESDRANQPV